MRPTARIPLLVVACLVVLSACGSGAAATSGGTSGGNQTQNPIRFGGGGGGPGGFFARMMGGNGGNTTGGSSQNARVQKQSTVLAVADLRISAVIYEHAACLVTGDSGPMHIASGVGAPVVALFGPTDPKLTGPRGRGESLVLQYVPPGYTIPFSGKNLPSDGWLSRITPEEVLNAVEKILRKA